MTTAERKKRDLAILTAYNQGADVNDLCERYGIDRSRVYQILKKLGADTDSGKSLRLARVDRSGFPKKPRQMRPDLKKAAELALSGKYPNYEAVARKMGMTKNQVCGAVYRFRGLEDAA